MSRNKGNKIAKKKQDKNKRHKKYDCEECLDTGILQKDSFKFPCPYCD